MATHGSNTGSQPSTRSVLDEDGKLSSASAATSLKYAKPQDLPSFPVAGLQMSSAGAAASLASSNKKSFEHWKPDPIPAANRAAILAKDYEMEPLWQPQTSSAGSKAAMLAHSNTSKNSGLPQVPDTRPKTISNTRPISTTAPAPAPAAYVPDETHKKALLAATASHNRSRSGSLPQPVDKSVQDSQWALKAATKSHKAGPPQISAPFTRGDPGFEAARIQNLAKNNVDRALFTSAPPVAIEVQEKNRQDMLKASAIAMAQKMYAIQQRQFEEAAGKSAQDRQALAASRARSSTVTGSSASVSDDLPVIGGGYENLEEAARKLAQERLAKIHDEHAEYRNYYVQTTSPTRSRLSTRMRRRASSGADADDSDEEDSRRIRSQMSIFQSKLAEVDSKKRQQDRDNLLEIAHRNVDARIRQMDDKVFQQTGKASPAQMEQWEKSAREKAQKDSDERMKYAGKVHIGGGKYLDQSELDAIAKARLQPTLDEISEKAERMRAKDEADRLERERLQAEAQAEKARQAETAAALKKLKEQQKQEEKAKRDEEKRVLKEQQAAEKAKRDEEKRLLKEQQNVEKEEKRKSKEAKSSRLSTLFGASGGAATGAAMGVTAAETSATGVTTTENPEETNVVAAVAYEELPEGQTFHDQVTSPTALAEKTTVHTQGSPEDGVVPPTTSTTTHEQVTSPLVLTAPPDPEPSTASPSNVQIIPATTTTSTEVPHTSVDAQKLESQKSVEAEDGAPLSPTKSSSRIKSWMKVKFGGRGKDAQKEADASPSVPTTSAVQPQLSSERDDAGLKATSMHDVAMAGKGKTNKTEDTEVSPVRGTMNVDTVLRSSSISSLSSSAYSGDENRPRDAKALSVTQHDSEGEDRGRPGFTERLLKKAKPEKDKTTDSAEPVISNTTEDEFEEARDTFEEEKLATHPPLSTATGEDKGTTALNHKSSKEGSRFTEEL